MSHDPPPTASNNRTRSPPPAPATAYSNDNATAFALVSAPTAHPSDRSVVANIELAVRACVNGLTAATSPPAKPYVSDAAGDSSDDTLAGLERIDRFYRSVYERDLGEPGPDAADVRDFVGSFTFSRWAYDVRAVVLRLALVAVCGIVVRSGDLADATAEVGRFVREEDLAGLDGGEWVGQLAQFLAHDREAPDERMVEDTLENVRTWVLTQAASQQQHLANPVVAHYLLKVSWLADQLHHAGLTLVPADVPGLQLRSLLPFREPPTSHAAAPPRTPTHQESLASWGITSLGPFLDAMAVYGVAFITHPGLVSLVTLLRVIRDNQEELEVEAQAAQPHVGQRVERVRFVVVWDVEVAVPVQRWHDLGRGWSDEYSAGFAAVDIQFVDWRGASLGILNPADPHQFAGTEAHGQVGLNLMDLERWPVMFVSGKPWAILLAGLPSGSAASVAASHSSVAAASTSVPPHDAPAPIWTVSTDSEQVAELFFAWVWTATAAAIVPGVSQGV